MTHAADYRRLPLSLMALSALVLLAGTALSWQMVLDSGPQWPARVGLWIAQADVAARQAASYWCGVLGVLATAVAWPALAVSVLTGRWEW